jgi:co-chaperonin GroES (HSP10)
VQEGDIVYYDRHAGHSIQVKEGLYKVIQVGDVVLVE